MCGITNIIILTDWSLFISKAWCIGMVVLPSSPVWYQSRGIDTSHNGILAFASRNLVFLLNLNNKNPEIHGILSGHSDKVTSCSFCPATNQSQLLRVVSGAEDCCVKVWDVHQQLLLHDHTSHGNCKIVSVHWSPVNPSLILSGDEKGFVVCWNLEKDTTDRFCPDGTSQMQLCCLTCSPHQENLVAIGYKSGAVSIMDLNMDGMVIKKLRGHTNEVHAVVWSPSEDEDLLVSKEPSDDVSVKDSEKSSENFGVIVTGSKDKSIKLWSISKGKCMRTLRVPSRPSKGRRTNEDVARLFVTLYWPQDSKSKFFSSGYNGDIVVWDISSDAENLFEILASRTHEAGHQRIVFNITHGINTNTIITTSMDRQLLHWTVPSNSASRSPGPDWSLPTLGGFVYSMSISPKDPSIVAVGVGDGMIRIWKTRSTRSAYDITTLWQGIKEKVMALAWHPVKEGCLAFATEDGKVGIYDTLSMCPPVVAETYHLKPVYALSWGPKCYQKLDNEAGNDASKKTTKSHLFSCGGDGNILQHDPNFSKDAVNIDSIITASNPRVNYGQGRHSEVSWSYNGQLVAIGSDNGVINIYLAPHLLHIIEIKSHSKTVNCIRWRPPNNEAGEDSPLQIASGSNNSVICLHDIEKTFSENSYLIGNQVDKPMSIIKPHRSLVGHISRVTSLCYNPRNDSEIVSSSYDGTAQVWNVDTEKPLFNFRGHHGRLMCVAWSPILPDSANAWNSGIIFTGADDYTIHGWCAEDQQHTEPVKCLPEFGFGPNRRFQSKKKGKNKKAPQLVSKPVKNNSDSAAISKDGRQALSPDINQLLEQKKKELLAAIGSDQETSQSEESKHSVELNTAASSAQDILIPENCADHPGTKTGTTARRVSPVADSKSNGDWKINCADDDFFPVRKRKRLKNMFPQSIPLDNRKKLDQHQDCVKIVRWKTKNVMGHDLNGETDSATFLPGAGKHINLGFYTDRRSAFRMMKNEAKKFQEDDNDEGNYNLRIWMGDVIGAIEDATAKLQLTDELVALAPMAGQVFWRKTAHAFAKQLVREDHHVHAVHYLLACDEVQEAVKVLLDNRRYREAVTLARARLCEDDPLLKQTVRTWAQKLKCGGSVELAAKCFASVGEFRDAANCVALRASLGAATVADSDVSALWAASSIARIAKEVDLATGFANRATNTVCMRTWNWSETNELLSAVSNLKKYSLMIIVHEILVTRLVTNGQLVEYQTAQKSKWNTPDLFYSEGQEGSSFLAQISHAWKISNPTDGEFSSMDRESCLELHDQALKLYPDQLTECRILHQIAVCACAAIVTSYHMNYLKNSHVSEGCVDADSDHLSRDSSSSPQDDMSGSRCVNHLIKALKISVVSQELSPTAKKEILVIICELVSWARRSGQEGLVPETTISNTVPNAIASLKVLCLQEIGGGTDSVESFSACLNGHAPETCNSNETFAESVLANR